MTTTAKVSDNRIKVCLLKYEPRQCWSVSCQKYYYSENIDNQVWAHENTPLRTYTMDLKDAIEYIKNNPGDSKAHRNAIMKFDSPFFPIKDLVGMDKWTGIIYVDLDIEKSNRLMKMDKENHSIFYNQLNDALKALFPNNYCYIEHSSSGVGIHAIFYFNCERTLYNFNKCAEYVYKVFRYDIDAYIKDFSHIFTVPECLKDNGRSKIFDEVYARPYQKIFITSKDYIYREVNGHCDNIVFELAEKDEEIKNEANTVTRQKIANHTKNNMAARNENEVLAYFLSGNSTVAMGGIKSNEEGKITVNYLVITDNRMRDIFKAGQTFTLQFKNKNLAANLQSADVKATKGNLMTGTFVFQGTGVM